jgi:hypothetical protein
LLNALCSKVIGYRAIYHVPRDRDNIGVVLDDIVDQGLEQGALGVRLDVKMDVGDMGYYCLAWRSLLQLNDLHSKSYTGEKRRRAFISVALEVTA